MKLVKYLLDCKMKNKHRPDYYTSKCEICGRMCGNEKGKNYTRTSR